MKEWGILTPIFKFYSSIISPIFDQDILHYKYALIIYHIMMFLPPLLILFGFSILTFIFKKAFESLKESNTKNMAIYFLKILQQCLNISFFVVLMIILTIFGGYSFLFTENNYYPYLIGFIAPFIFINIVWTIYYYVFSNSLDQDYCSRLFNLQHIISFMVYLSIFVSLILSLTTCNICSTFMPTEFSSSFTRLFSPDYCHTKICNVYLTVSNETDGTIINFHSKYLIEDISIQYDYQSHLNSEKYQFKILPIVDHVKNPFIQRYVYKVFLQKLNPGIIYFRIKNQHYQSQEFKFKKSNQIHFIVGGDMGTTQSALKMYELAKSYEPSFILIGGDIAYTNAVNSCYQRWDFWFHHVTKPSPNGYLIPILTSVGNHDTGGYFQDKSEIPFYIHYFPHEFESNYLKRNTYHSHIFQNIILFSLDSDHSESLSKEGDQLKWLNEKLKENRKKFKILTYHVPIYPSPIKVYYQQKTIDLRKSLLPIIDRYQVNLVFENHVHSFKRSKMLRNEKVVNEKGTIFVGDGK